MTRAQLQATVYLIDENGVYPTTYKDYLREYGADETTTPKGVAPRYHIREKEDEDGNPVFQIWTWGVGGNNPRYTREQYDNEDDAELALYGYFKLGAERNDQHGGFFRTEKEAQEVWNERDVN